MYLWRAVDDEGEVLEGLVQSRRNKKAALQLMRKSLNKHCFLPAAIVTDKLPSHGGALRVLKFTQINVLKGTHGVGLW
jgi:putative transposase